MDDAGTFVVDVDCNFWLPILWQYDIYPLAPARTGDHSHLPQLTLQMLHCTAGWGGQEHTDKSENRETDDSAPFFFWSLIHFVDEKMC